MALEIMVTAKITSPRPCRTLCSDFIYLLLSPYVNILRFTARNDISSRETAYREVFPKSPGGFPNLSAKREFC